MKKRVRILLCLLSLTLLTACGVGGNPDAPRSAGDPPAEPRELSKSELRRWSEFLCQADCYGFLMSNYSTPLDANLSEVFYSGAGVGESPSEEALSDYLDAMGFEEAYAEVTFIPYDGANAVLERRTGYTLEHFKLADADLPMYYSQTYKGYFHMAGDTNAIRVECESGIENPDGSITLKSREKSWLDEEPNPEDYASADSVCTFETVLKPNPQGGDYIFDRNQVTGGWLTWYQEYNPDDGEITSEFTLETPPFSYAYNGFNPPETAYPVTLELRLERENGISDASDWMAAHWDEWMNDAAFAQRYDAYENEGVAPLDRLRLDPYFLYDTDGATLHISSPENGALLYSIDFTAYLSPDGSASPDDWTAQTVRYPRIVNGNLFASNFHGTYAAESDGLNGYLTCISLFDGDWLWRSDPLVCNSKNFVVLGVGDGNYVEHGVIVCGYGFTGEDDYLYQLDLDTGVTLERMPVASAPDCLVYANGLLYVHCYDRDYEFEISFG